MQSARPIGGFLAGRADIPFVVSSRAQNAFDRPVLSTGRVRRIQYYDDPAVIDRTVWS
jgi:hypothetical protein